MAAISKTDLETVELTLQQFRVNELHVLLQTFKCPKLGKKSELVHRCISLLNNSRNQVEVLHKIHEINSSRRYQNLGPAPALHNPLQQSAPSAITPGGPQLSHYPQQQESDINMITRSMHQASAVRQQHQALANNAQSGLMNQHNQATSTHQRTRWPPAQPNSSTYLPPANRAARMLNIMKLPFYQETKTLLELSELPANAQYARGTARTGFTFHVPAEVRRNLLYGTRPGDPVILPRVELQLRFFELNLSRDVAADDFPPSCEVKIDNASVQLPNVVQTNKPNTELKRPSRPVCITNYVQHSRDPDAHHKILIEWYADRRAWAVGIFVVNRLTAEVLMSRLVQNVHARRDTETTREQIRKTMSADEDDGFQTDSIRIPLICPLGKTRLITPVKGARCVHLQCFDVTLYLQMNEKRPTWKCPICDKHTPYDKLIIDGYVEDVLRRASVETTEVDLLADGEWRAVVDGGGNSDDGSGPSTKRSRSNTSTPIEGGAQAGLSMAARSQAGGHQGHRKNSALLSNRHTESVEPEVICLDSSDDEIELLPRTKQARTWASTPNAAASSTKRHKTNSGSAKKRQLPANTHASITTNQQIVCITLDDTDPEPKPRLVSQTHRASPSQRRPATPSQRRPTTPVNGAPPLWYHQYSPVAPTPPAQQTIADIMNNAAGGSVMARGASGTTGGPSTMSGGLQQNGGGGGGTASASTSHQSGSSVAASSSTAYDSWFTNPPPPMYESVAHFGPNGFEPQRYPIYNEAFNSQIITDELRKFMAGIHNATSR